MDFSELFQQYPLFREMLTAFTVIFVDFCALVILLAAFRERKRGDKIWAREGKGYMLICEDVIFPLGAAEILIGRHPSADIHFEDEEISRFHALLTLSNGRWSIEDVGAANGVMVNGKRIHKPQLLHISDQIQIGKRQLTVIQGSGKGGKS